MKNLALRDFQQKGKRALKGRQDEPILLTGRGEARYFLVPIIGTDIETEYRELVRAMALTNLRSWQLRAKTSGLSKMTAKEIDEEISGSRKKRSHK